MDDPTVIQVTAVVRYTVRPHEGFTISDGAQLRPEQMLEREQESLTLGHITLHDIIQTGEIHSVTFSLV